MNNTNKTPNKKPAGSAAPHQSKPANRTASTQARPTGTKPATNGARPATGAKPTSGTRPATGARPTGNAQKPQNANRNAQPPHKKKKGLGKDGVLAIIMLLLVVILAAIIIICCVKAIADTISGNGTTAGSTTVNTAGSTTEAIKTDPVFTTPVVGAWNEGYVTTNRKNTVVNEGNLILVNNDHAYTFPASLKLTEMWGQNGYGSVYLLGTGMTYPTGPKPIELSSNIVEHITSMLIDMKEANSSLTSSRKLMIASGYRTYEKQETLYTNDSESGLVAKPGHSEHHTGLTVDIRIATDADKSGNLFLNETEQAWITANCAKYGFILRYTEDNKDITQIGGEDWHFRYVGVAHATYMVEHDLCLEEYIAFLREKHAYGTNEPLNYAAEGKEYSIYYFPASVEKDNTDIYVPASGHYEISGNNVDGFIVTVTHESK